MRKTTLNAKQKILWHMPIALYIAGQAYLGQGPLIPIIVHAFDFCKVKLVQMFEFYPRFRVFVNYCLYNYCAAIPLLPSPFIAGHIAG